MIASDGATGSAITYSRQFRRCGRAGCLTCQAGGHGPYWYAYWREGGRRHARYLGKQPPSGLPAEAIARLAASPAGTATRLPALRVRTLGAFAIWQGTRLIPPACWRQCKVAALLKCLVNAPRQRLQRGQVVEWLWPAAGPVEGARLLHATLRRLRQVLDRPGAAVSHLRLVGNLVVLAPTASETPAPDWCDADAFSQAAAAALAGADPGACRAALALYRGEYLPDDLDADWAAPRREALRRTRLALLLRLGELSPEAEEAIAALETVLRVDPCHEEAARRLLRLLGATNRRVQAVQVYRSQATALWHELGIPPSAPTRAAYLATVGDVAPDLPIGTVTVLMLRAAANEEDRSPLLDALLARCHGGILAPRAECAERCLVFARASDALAAAYAVRQAFSARAGDAAPGAYASWLRMAVHTGEAEMTPDGGHLVAYERVIEHGAHLLAAAHEGQVLLSVTAWALARQALPAATRVRLLGAFCLPGSTQAEPVFDVLYPARPSAAPRAHATNLPASLPAADRGQPDGAAAGGSRGRNRRRVVNAWCEIAARTALHAAGEPVCYPSCRVALYPSSP